MLSFLKPKMTAEALGQTLAKGALAPMKKTTQGFDTFVEELVKKGARQDLIRTEMGILGIFCNVMSINVAIHQNKLKEEQGNKVLDSFINTIQAGCKDVPFSSGPLRNAGTCLGETVIMRINEYSEILSCVDVQPNEARDRLFSKFCEYASDAGSPTGLKLGALSIYTQATDTSGDFIRSVKIV